MSRRELHRAHNQDLARVARFRPQEVSFVCECDAPDCEARVHMRVSDYEAIVARPGAHVAAEGHEHVWRQSRTA